MGSFIEMKQPSLCGPPYPKAAGKSPVAGSGIFMDLEWEVPADWFVQHAKKVKVCLSPPKVGGQ